MLDSFEHSIALAARLPGFGQLLGKQGPRKVRQVFQSSLVMESHLVDLIPELLTW
jgi:hypothetical protein